MSRFPTGSCCIAAIIALTACGDAGLHVRYYNDLNRRILAADYPAATKFMSQSKSLYGEKSSLIFHADQAMIALLAGRYDDSNRQVAAAEEVIDKLFTKSAGKQVASFLTCDATLPYHGEDFEKVFVNVIGALSWAALGKADEAVVEAKRADLKLQEIARLNNGGSYSEDAFVRFLMGLVYEDGGEVNDAWISYSRAITTYEKQEKLFGVVVPNLLLWRAASTAIRLGFNTELDALRQKYGDRIPLDPAGNKGAGRLVLVELAGRVPLKIEVRIEVTLGQGMAFVQAQEIGSDDASKVSSALTVAKTMAVGTNVAVAIPKMVGSPPGSQWPELRVEGVQGVVARSELVESLGSIAYKCLEERMGRIWARTVARVVVKYLLTVAAAKVGEKAGGDKYGGLVGLLAGGITGAALFASEHADTRSWGTLPYEVRLAILEAPPGTYDVVAGHGGGEIARFNGVRVEADRSQYLVLRTR